MRILTVLLFAALTIPFAAAQQNQDATPESTKQAASKKDKKPAPANTATPDKSAESGKPAEPPNQTPAKLPIKTRKNITMWPKSRP